MRKTLFLSSIIAISSILTAYGKYSAPCPRLRIVEEEDVRGNSFFDKDILLHFETDRGANCTARLADRHLPPECLTQIFEGETTVKYELKSLEDYLQYGCNNLEICAENSLRKKTFKILTIEIGAVEEEIEKIQFTMCRRAWLDFKQNPELYVQTARQIQDLNEKLKGKYDCKKVIIPYVTPRDLYDETEVAGRIERGGTATAWFFNNRIIIGNAIFTRFKDTNEARDNAYHEFGHGVYVNSPLWVTNSAGEAYAAMIGSHDALFKLFKDSEYTADPSDGHPHSNPNELFASAFMVRMNYYDKFLERIRAFPPEEQKLAMKVMEVVDMAIKKE